MAPLVRPSVVRGFITAVRREEKREEGRGEGEGRRHLVEFKRVLVRRPGRTDGRTYGRLNADLWLAD